MVVLHLNWTDGGLHLWAESSAAYHHRGAPEGGGHGGAIATIARHPFAASAADIRARLLEANLVDAAALDGETHLRLRLPCDEKGPHPSDRLAAASEVLAVEPEAMLGEFEVPALTLAPAETLAAMLQLEDRGPTRAVAFGHSVRYWEVVARFVLELLADQRFILTLMQRGGHRLCAAWHPWVRDEAVNARAAALLKAMPPVVRAVVDAHDSHPWRILEEALRVLTDAAVRRVLSAETFIDALDGRDPRTDPHVAWLEGLLDERAEVLPPAALGLDMLTEVRQWIARLEQTGADQPLRLGLKLSEPSDVGDQPNEMWRLSLHLVSVDGIHPVLSAEQVWTQPTSLQLEDGRRLDQPQQLLLAELGRASRIYPSIEAALADAAPTGIDLTTAQAYEFLTDYRPVLEESGFAVIVPSWWGEPQSRLGARLLIESDPLPEDEFAGMEDGAFGGIVGLGLHSIVRYRWQIAVGNQPLSLEQFQRLAEQGGPLVRVGGRWIEVKAADIATAAAFLRQHQGGHMTVLEALRLAHNADAGAAGAAGAAAGPPVPVVGLDATGWVGRLFGATSDEPGQARMPLLPQPRDFHGTLRPYQRAGMSWLAFLDRFGLGACLADDMGLGKTIQLIALLQAEREHARLRETIGPTLLVVPTSVVSNWTRELERFAPELTWHVQHGVDRPTGDAFAAIARQRDVVITTYALVSRDAPSLLPVQWHRVVLDEAQYIKNPPTKQATAIRAVAASTSRRVALTGTPVENRLTELWSIMEFCNPSYLGTSNDFRKRFAVPIERHRDPRQADRLRGLVRPFVLRRLKIDPTVISDLPECLETKEYATLTTEQAAMYQHLVDSMLTEVDSAEGMQRRGLVLAALVKLKQLCDHPGLLLKDTAAGWSGNGEAGSAGEGAHPLVNRSGKCQRLLAMLEEVLAAGDRALVFTQFREMGHLLTAMIQHGLDCEALFLHGGTPQAKRQQMIDRFQAPDGRVPVFVLSLKAGGLGLNLTAANHVFHFDRWWNPAVENQATDRAFRIGQHRTVHVHKFVCMGTLEERIDEMLEHKAELAENIIGAGEAWLTELSTGQLRDILTLRQAAMEVEG